MQEEVPAKFRPRRFHAVEYHEEFVFTAQVKKLACHLASFMAAVSAGEIGGGVGIVRVMLEGDNMTSLARQTFTFVNMAQETSVVLIVFVAPKFFVGVEDGYDVED
jgi:hypothetical protein